MTLLILSSVIQENNERAYTPDVLQSNLLRKSCAVMTTENAFVESPFSVRLAAKACEDAFGAFWRVLLVIIDRLFDGPQVWHRTPRRGGPRSYLESWVANEVSADRVPSGPARLTLWRMQATRFNWEGLPIAERKSTAQSTDHSELLHTYDTGLP